MKKLTLTVTLVLAAFGVIKAQEPMKKPKTDTSYQQKNDQRKDPDNRYQNDPDHRDNKYDQHRNPTDTSRSNKYPPDDNGAGHNQKPGTNEQAPMKKDSTRTNRPK